MAADIDLGQDHRLVGPRVGIDPDAGKQQRALDMSARHDAAARDHRIDRDTAAVLVVEDKLGRRQLFLQRGHGFPEEMRFGPDVQIDVIVRRLDPIDVVRLHGEEGEPRVVPRVELPQRAQRNVDALHLLDDLAVRVGRRRLGLDLGGGELALVFELVHPAEARFRIDDLDVFPLAQEQPLDPHL